MKRINGSLSALPALAVGSSIVVLWFLWPFHDLSPASVLYALLAGCALFFGGLEQCQRCHLLPCVTLLGSGSARRLHGFRHWAGRWGGLLRRHFGHVNSFTG